MCVHNPALGMYLLETKPHTPSYFASAAYIVSHTSYTDFTIVIFFLQSITIPRMNLSFLLSKPTSNNSSSDNNCHMFVYFSLGHVWVFYSIYLTKWLKLLTLVSLSTYISRYVSVTFLIQTEHLFLQLQREKSLIEDKHVL
jgi:hypothetical protein